LILLAIPSFALLFQTDEYKDPFMVVQISGNQWYWSYSITTTLCKMSFDSYMSVFEGSQEYKGFKRLLEITNALYVPHDLAIRVLITSNDVLHCWAIPALGIKVDAVPGRLNQTFIETTKEGTFYGQCSEICGVNHGFMPIKVVSIRI
jgi:heme/copper-type cytochrome/quinol oxidase subunit 2